MCGGVYSPDQDRIYLMPLAAIVLKLLGTTLIVLMVVSKVNILMVPGVTTTNAPYRGVELIHQPRTGFI
jgi:hypothetical protein